MPEAIFFDLDDTIILFLTSTKTVWENAVKRYLPELGGAGEEAVYKAIRAAADWYWADPERHRRGRLDLRKARREIGELAFTSLNRKDFTLAHKIADFYSDERDSSGTLAPGAIATLENLRARGIKLALITNGASDMQRQKIDQFGLGKYFENILIEGEFACGKPDERVFRYTMDKLGVKPSAAWMVGDNPKFDIAPCTTLGIYTVWVNGQSDKPLDGVKPDKTIKDISEVPGLL